MIPAREKQEDLSLRHRSRQDYERDDELEP